VLSLFGSLTFISQLQPLPLGTLHEPLPLSLYSSMLSIEFSTQCLSLSLDLFVKLLPFTCQVSLRLLNLGLELL
jgi:hypothetical protein